jgi:hypothetical protein
MQVPTLNIVEIAIRAIWLEMSDSELSTKMDELSGPYYYVSSHGPVPFPKLSVEFLRKTIGFLWFDWEGFNKAPYPIARVVLAKLAIELMELRGLFFQ